MHTFQFLLLLNRTRTFVFVLYVFIMAKESLEHKFCEEVKHIYFVSFFGGGGGPFCVNFFFVYMGFPCCKCINLLSFM